MRSLACGLTTGALVLTLGQAALPACGDAAGDDEAVATVRAVVAATCDCGGAPTHGHFVRCAAAVTRGAVRGHTLPTRCKGTIIRCAARSSCGRPGTVACCRTDAAGVRRCGVRSAAACIAPPGGRACAATSCCDACPLQACGPSPTTTTIPPPGPCSADPACDDGNPCSLDRCAGGTCTHECLCVAPGGRSTCCPGPIGACDLTTWYYTCGDPVCRIEPTDPGPDACPPEAKAGNPCSPEGARCDPGDACNARLVCARIDPVLPGLCPISRRRYKQNIRYLDDAGRRRLHDAVVRLPLATYEYRTDAAHPRLGFVIEDVEPSPSVDGAHDMVDLYGYTSMAVAAIQEQAREIARLRDEVRRLTRELDTRGR